MLSAAFFTGYTVSQLGFDLQNISLIPSCPLIWAGGEYVKDVGFCLDRSTELPFFWNRRIGLNTWVIDTWVDAFLDNPDLGGKGSKGLSYFPEQARKRLAIYEKALLEEARRSGRDLDRVEWLSDQIYALEGWLAGFRRRLDSAVSYSEKVGEDIYWVDSRGDEHQVITRKRGYL